MDRFYQKCWIALKSYIREKNSHGKNELLEKMMDIEVKLAEQEIFVKEGSSGRSD